MEKTFKPVFETTRRPLIIGGPCSAESEEQVLETAHALAKQGVDAYRAGIWKPRTRPGEFEGVGTIGLPWLKRVKEETGLKVTTEVANTQHVFDALKAGIDILWIGARTTVNPFSVQEVADALKGTDIPVLIKNPVNPDLKLWMGAVERIAKAGITRIGLIHRGFSSFGNTNYRNIPLWQIGIDIRMEFPDMQILVDNSHICGRRDTLQAVAQRALDLNFDGIMTEVHPRPDEAWSDAKQQITPDQFLELRNSLILRKTSTNDPDFTEHIEHYRHEIDEIDSDIINLLGRRMSIADNIGEYKKRNNISILQSARWNEILERIHALSRAKGISDDTTETIFHAIHHESINRQAKIMDGTNVEA